MLSLCWGILGFRAADQYIYAHNADNVSDLELADTVKENAREGRVYYLYSPEDFIYIDLIQYAVKEIPIRICFEAEEIEGIENGSLLLLSNADSGKEKADTVYTRIGKSSHFTLYQMGGDARFYRR